MISFYLRLIQRQSRLAAVRLFCAAIAVACAVTFSITLLGNRLEQLFDQQSREVLAADLVLQSTAELTPQQLNIIKPSALTQARLLIFPTMAYGNDGFLLSSVKAVSDLYPLRGRLQISDGVFGKAESSDHGPPPGEIWVENRVLHELGLAQGEMLTIGERSLKITRILVFEPDRGNNFYSFTPRIMMHWDDVDSTRVVQPGSRIRFRYLFAGEAGPLADLQQRLLPTLQLNQEFITIDAANKTLAAALKRAYQFLYVAALIAILLGAVSVALVSYQYADEMTHQYALLRCLGLHGRRLYGAILLPFVSFTLVATAVGSLLGGGLHGLIMSALGELLIGALPAPTMEPFWLSGATILIVVSGFAWPFLRSVLDTRPGILLNQPQSPRPIIFTGAAMAVGLMMLIFVGTGEILISIYIMAALCAFIICAYFIIQAGISWMIRRSRTGAVATRLAARMLGANRRLTSMQIIAVAVIFFSLALMQTLRDDLILSWQSKVPEQAPNFFAINLFPTEKADFINFLDRENVPHSQLYPVVRGRLSGVNEVPIREYASKESGRTHESLSRDLALTWSASLPADNKIIAGKWHDARDDSAVAEVSVEQGIAEKLRIKLGDRVEFTVNTRKFSARVNSIRSVEWESFRPNFYMIFRPGALAGLPATYMASLHIAPERRELLPQFIQHFPTATFFDVDFLLNRIRGIIQKISTAVEIILYVSLVAGLIVFIAVEMVLRRYRRHSTAVYKSLGATTALIRKIYRSQLLLSGLMAGAVAYILNLTIGMIVSVWLIGGSYVFNIKTAMLCLLITPILVIITGYVSISQSSKARIRDLLAQT